MAIDTINEKLALIEYGDVFQPGIPISNDGIGQDDKQQLLWGYPGILWEVIVTAVGLVTITFTSKKPDIILGSKQPTMAFISKQPDMTFVSEQPNIVFVSKKPKIDFGG